jgi:hypothetical protein
MHKPSALQKPPRERERERGDEGAGGVAIDALITNSGAEWGAEGGRDYRVIFLPWSQRSQGEKRGSANRVLISTALKQILWQGSGKRVALILLQTDERCGGTESRARSDELAAEWK